MFKNSDSDNDTEAGHMHNGRLFKEFPLANLFKQNYDDEGFYSGEELDLMDEENLESARPEEGKAKEPHREEPEASRTVQTVEVSTITPPVDSTTLRNQSNQSHQSV
jgi:hypothetical protein